MNEKILLNEIILLKEKILLNEKKIAELSGWCMNVCTRVLRQPLNFPTTTISITEATIEKLERFVVLMYDRTSSCESVNECRRLLFTQKNRAIENIPPTLDALMQHVKRAALQTRIWKTCLTAVNSTMNPCDWGWKKISSGDYEPVWNTLPDVASHCSELVSCNCKLGCKTCKCRTYNLPCTQLCKCEGRCSESADYHSYKEFEAAIETVYDIVEDEHEVDNVVDVVFSDCDDD